MKFHEDEEDDVIDLFEDYESLPQSVQDAIVEFDIDNPSIAVDVLEKKLTPLGYVFEYGLDYEPYNLKKIV